MANFFLSFLVFHQKNNFSPSEIYFCSLKNIWGPIRPLHRSKIIKVVPPPPKKKRSFLGGGGTKFMCDLFQKIFNMKCIQVIFRSPRILPKLLFSVFKTILDENLIWKKNSKNLPTNALKCKKIVDFLNFKIRFVVGNDRTLSDKCHKRSSLPPILTRIFILPNSKKSGKNEKMLCPWGGG